MRKEDKEKGEEAKTVTDRPIRELPLINGLLLQVWDESRSIVGDRFQVVVRFTIAVPLEPGPIAEAFQQAGHDLALIRGALGDSVLFEQRMTRNFIDARMKADLVENLCQSFLDSTRPYLSAADFAVRFVLQRFSACQRQGKIDQFFKNK